ncbi:hypothetical protein A8A01_04460 [Ewingella americana]|nr:hypothetical protein A8A01_04460 [Ewingella americana]
MQMVRQELQAKLGDKVQDMSGVKIGNCQASNKVRNLSRKAGVFCYIENRKLPNKKSPLALTSEGFLPLGHRF